MADAVRIRLQCDKMRTCEKRSEINRCDHWRLAAFSTRHDHCIYRLFRFLCHIFFSCARVTRPTDCVCLFARRHIIVLPNNLWTISLHQLHKKPIVICNFSFAISLGHCVSVGWMKDAYAYDDITTHRTAIDTPFYGSKCETNDSIYEKRMIIICPRTNGILSASTSMASHRRHQCPINNIVSWMNEWISIINSFSIPDTRTPQADGSWQTANTAHCLCVAPDDCVSLCQRTAKPDSYHFHFDHSLLLLFAFVVSHSECVVHSPGWRLRIPFCHSSKKPW